MLSRVKPVHFWLEYNGLAIVRTTTKLIEGGLHDYRHICYYFYFLRFLNPKSRDFLRFCRVSYALRRFLELHV